MDDELKAVEDFVKGFVRSIWGYEVGVDVHRDELGIVAMIVHENPRNLAFIVGREGSNIKAVRTLTHVWNRRNGGGRLSVSIMPFSK